MSIIGTILTLCICIAIIGAAGASILSAFAGFGKGAATKALGVKANGGKLDIFDIASKALAAKEAYDIFTGGNKK